MPPCPEGKSGRARNPPAGMGEGDFFMHPLEYAVAGFPDGDIPGPLPFCKGEVVQREEDGLVRSEKKIIRKA